MLVLPALIHLLPGGTKTVHRLMKRLSQIYPDELVPASLPFVAMEQRDVKLPKNLHPARSFSDTQLENKMEHLGNEVLAF